jgi:glycosyltransferase involved in cell wall biosynthesis
MIDAARQDSRIMVTGAVPDTRPYLAAATAMVVPLFQGGGTRFKILEAFAANLPVISTGKGAEGLGVENKKHLLLAETADEFVEAIQLLWTDGHLAKQLAANGLQLVKESYSFPVISRQIRDAVRELCPKADSRNDRTPLQQEQ